MIPEAAVEAAVDAWAKRMRGCFSPEEVPFLRDELRVILEAAAPHLLAEAWDDGHSAGVDHADGLWSPDNPYRSAK